MLIVICVLVMPNLLSVGMERYPLLLFFPFQPSDESLPEDVQANLTKRRVSPTLNEVQSLAVSVSTHNYIRINTQLLSLIHIS